jgi:hypothetical protein
LADEHEQDHNALRSAGPGAEIIPCGHVPAPDDTIKVIDAEDSELLAVTPDLKENGK